MANEITQQQLLGRNVRFQLNEAGAERIGFDRVQIKVTDIKSVQNSHDNALEIVSIGGYDTEYNSVDIYGEEIRDIEPILQPSGSKDVTAEDLDKWRKS